MTSGRSTWSSVWSRNKPGYTRELRRSGGRVTPVLREAIESGVDHIDTSDFYGPHVTNQIIRRALHPYPKGLVIVTKVGARRGNDKSWIHDVTRKSLIDSVHDNLRNLGDEALEVVNFWAWADNGQSPGEEPLTEPLSVFAELKQQGLN